MGRPKGPNRKIGLQGTTGDRRIAKKAKPTTGNSIGKFFVSQTADHNLKLGENIFEQLTVDTQQKQNSGTSTKTKTKTKITNKKPPPVIVTGKIHDVNKILKENGIESFQMKNISIGTKVFVDNDNDFTKISTLFKQNDIEFFSHNQKDLKVCKAVLSGLPEISTDTIREELTTLNIHPTQIFQMKTKNPSTHRALYLVHLNANETTFQDLQKIKSLYHTIIRWSKYNPRSRGPTQCRNCTMYGHGTQNCNRKPTCTLCASKDHNQAGCPLKSLSNDASPVFKCSYCTKNNIQPSNHRASDIECPGRKIYLDLRKPSYQKEKLNNQRRRQVDESYNNTKRFMPAPPPPPLTQSYRNVLSNDIHQHANQNQSNEMPNDELFTTAELFKIFMSAIQDIKNCKTKLDQIQVVATLISHVLQ